LKMPLPEAFNFLVSADRDLSASVLANEGKKMRSESK
jgi:hypothetical protein